MKLLFGFLSLVLVSFSVHAQDAVKRDDGLRGVGMVDEPEVSDFEKGLAHARGRLT